MAVAFIAIGCGGRQVFFDADGGSVAASSTSACGQSLDDYCASHDCVRDYADAEKPQTWCKSARQMASISDAPCGGLAVITYSPSADVALAFYYDVASGRLVGVAQADGIDDACVASAPDFARDPSCSFAMHGLCDSF
jgi:hypothetical protein